jgi:hypothetical protein
MLTLHDNNIILGSIGGGGVAPPANGWLAPPAMTTTAMNGLTDACGLFCNVLDIGDRNYFSCLAAGDYTVSIYTSVGGTLISSQNIAANVQCNWQIDWDACTHNIDDDTRQAYVEITPQAGQSLTLLRFNTDHPAETNVNSAPNFVSVYGVLPALTTASSMFYACYALQSVTLPSLPALTTASSMFYACYALQSVTLPSLPALTTASSMFAFCYALQSVTLPSLPALTTATNMFAACYALQSVTLPSLPALTTATNMFTSCYALQSVTLPSLPALTTASGMFTACYALQSVTLPSLPALTTASGMFSTATESQCLRSVRKLSTPALGTAFPNATTFVLRHTAIQEAEALAWVDSLGTSTNTITFDLRNNPFSTSTLVAPAILAKFPNAVVQLV